MAWSEDFLTFTARGGSPFLECFWGRCHCLSGDKGVSGQHFCPPTLRIGTETPGEDSKVRQWLLSELCSKLHTSGLWWDCPSGSNLHHPQTRTGPQYIRSLKIRILKLSQPDWGRAKVHTVLQQEGKQPRHRHWGNNDLINSMKGVYSFLWECFPDIK